MTMAHAGPLEDTDADIESPDYDRRTDTSLWHRPPEYRRYQPKAYPDFKTYEQVAMTHTPAQHLQQLFNRPIFYDTPHSKFVDAYQYLVEHDDLWVKYPSDILTQESTINHNNLLPIAEIDSRGPGRNGIHGKYYILRDSPSSDLREFRIVGEESYKKRKFYKVLDPRNAFRENAQYDKTYLVRSMFKATLNNDGNYEVTPVDALRGEFLTLKA